MNKTAKISLPRFPRATPKSSGRKNALKLLGASAAGAAVAGPIAHHKGKEKGHRIGHEHARANIQAYLASQRKTLTGTSKGKTKQSSATPSLDKAAALAGSTERDVRQALAYQTSGDHERANLKLRNALEAIDKVKTASEDQIAEFFAVRSYNPYMVQLSFANEMNKHAGVMSSLGKAWVRGNKAAFNAVVAKPAERGGRLLYKLTTKDPDPLRKRIGRGARAMFKKTKEDPTQGNTFFSPGRGTGSASPVVRRGATVSEAMKRTKTKDELYEAAKARKLEQGKEIASKAKTKGLSAAEKIREAIHGATAPKKVDPMDALKTRAKETYKTGRGMVEDGAEKTKEFAKTHKKELAGGGALAGLAVTGAGYHKAKQRGLIS